MNRFYIEKELNEIENSGMKEQDAINKVKQIICEYISNKYNFKFKTSEVIYEQSLSESFDYDLFSYSYLFTKCLNVSDFVKDILVAENED